MRRDGVWRGALVLGNVKILDVRQEADVVVCRVAPPRRRGPRCGRCGKVCPWYDPARGPRRWRALDVGCRRAWVEAEVGRVSCPEHGVVVERVPWAWHGSGFTRSFEEQVAWLAMECSKTAVGNLMRISWRSVGNILERVARRLVKPRQMFANLRRIGIDEISYRRGQRYLVVVIDHDTGRLVWAADGRDSATVGRFFRLLGPRRCRRITEVSADGATWITGQVRRHCPQAVIALDPFHAVQWATNAVDQVRREVWNQARHAGHRGLARAIKRSRWALTKNAEDLTPKQEERLAWIEEVNQPLFRAHLLKEHLRLVFQLPFEEALDLLVEWVEWALYSEIEPFEKLGLTIVNHIEAIVITLERHLSNAIVEALNTRIRLLTRRAFGFHSAAPLIALATLSFGGQRPALPGRTV